LLLIALKIKVVKHDTLRKHAPQPKDKQKTPTIELFHNSVVSAFFKQRYPVPEA